MTSGDDKITWGKPLSFVLESDLAELDQLQAMVESFGRVHELEKKTIFEMNLVMEEIFTNIIAYGHSDTKRHQVQFFLEYNEDKIIIQIKDDGVHFNLLEAEPVDPCTDLEHRSVGGLGIHFVRKLMDEVTYQRVGLKNVVTLRKNCRKKVR